MVGAAIDRQMGVVDRPCADERRTLQRRPLSALSPLRSLPSLLDTSTNEAVMAPTKILFFPLSERGQLNVALAVSSALLSRPDLSLHLASFSDAAPRVEDLRQRFASSDSSLSFHELPGPGMVPAARRTVEQEEIAHGLGMKELKRTCETFMRVLSPWTKEEYGAIYQACFDLINELDPDLVVMDVIFAPALDALKVVRPPRNYAFLLPNSLKDSLGAAAKFWKYPASVSSPL